MRKRIATAWLAGIALASWSMQLSFAQRRAPTADHGLAYVYSAFLTQADPGVMDKRVGIGPELQKRLGLAPDADGAKVYAALIGLAGEKAIDVRKATPDELAQYGARRGFEPGRPHPLYALEAGEQRFLVQYDLQALRIAFVGQLGVPDPDPVAKAIPVAAAGLTAAPARPQPMPVSLQWTGHFEFDSAMLTPAGRAALDSEIVPKLAQVEVRAFRVSGHADRLGSPQYNQRLSEKRAEAVRSYLVGMDVDPDRIEVFGYGQTLPTASCREAKGRALIDCLAPNRRAVVEIEGVIASPALEARQMR
jgi:outer membrane protein OmpA-like peptidoglycan-associated protein